MSFTSMSKVVPPEHMPNFTICFYTLTYCSCQYWTYMGYVDITPIYFWAISPIGHSGGGEEERGRGGEEERWRGERRREGGYAVHYPDEKLGRENLMLLQYSFRESYCYCQAWAWSTVNYCIRGWWHREALQEALDKAWQLRLAVSSQVIANLCECQMSTSWWWITVVLAVSLLTSLALLQCHCTHCVHNHLLPATVQITVILHS